jgi:hypothetical protein
MRFPVDVTFKLLGWRAAIHLTDGSGRMIGYVPPSRQPDGQLSIYANEGLGPPIYTIRAQDPFTQWFEDAAGRRIGTFGLDQLGQGKFIFVAGEPRFQFVEGSEWLDFVDRLIPSVPILNGLTGLFVRPRVLAVRMEGGTEVLQMVKKRMAIDIRYSLGALGEIDGSECECLVLSAVIRAMQDHYFKTIH